MYQQEFYPSSNGNIFTRPQPGDTVQRDDVVIPQQQQPATINQANRLIAPANETVAPVNEFSMRIVLNVVVKVRQENE